MARSRSCSQSSSDSCVNPKAEKAEKYLKKKEKKYMKILEKGEKKKHHDHDHDHDRSTAFPVGVPVTAPSVGKPLMPSVPQGAQRPLPSSTPGAPGSTGMHFPEPNLEQPRAPLSPHSPGGGAYTQPAQRAPLSGYRIPLTGNSPFPAEAQAGPPPCRDADGVSPVYVGSALFEKSVHPCKIAPALPTPCRVPYGGAECEHKGRYDLLPITSDMQWVHTSHGRIPDGLKPVEGGYEESGQKLYHALGVVDGVKVPGKCSEHLNGAHVAFGGQEKYVSDYQVL